MHEGGKRFYAGVAVLVLSMLTGCGGPSQEAGRYYDRKQGFSIQFPDDWKKQKSTMGVMVTFGSAEDTAKVGIQKQKTSSQQTLADLGEYMEAHIQRNGGRIEERGGEMIDDHDAIWLLSEVGRENSLSYYIQKEDHIYSILCTANRDDFEVSEMREVARSFRFE